MYLTGKNGDNSTNNYKKTNTLDKDITDTKSNQEF